MPRKGNIRVKRHLPDVGDEGQEHEDDAEGEAEVRQLVPDAFKRLRDARNRGVDVHEDDEPHGADDESPEDYCQEVLLDHGEVHGLLCVI